MTSHFVCTSPESIQGSGVANGGGRSSGFLEMHLCGFTSRIGMPSPQDAWNYVVFSLRFQRRREDHQPRWLAAIRRLMWENWWIAPVLAAWLDAMD